MKETINLNRIFREIDKYNIISFDVFDTLIKRDVNHYKEVFSLLESQVIKEYGSKYEGLAIKRINAEKTARDFLKREISLDEIYNFMDVDIAGCVKKIELQVEYELVQPNLIIKPVFDYCAKADKKIIIISDMYLPTGQMERMLKKCGYDGFFRIYVSGDYGKTKRNGKLFDFVKNDLKERRILHIGDSLRSDFLMGKIYGFSCIKIKKEYDCTESIDASSSIKAFVNNRIGRFEGDYAKKVGYGIYGPFILGYIQWIRKNVVKEKIDRIYFASRDGYIMKQVYDLMYGDDSNIMSHYIRVSRRSLQVPLIGMDNNVFDTFLSVTSFSQVEKTSNIYSRLGFDYCVETEKLIQQVEIDDFLKHDNNIIEHISDIVDNATCERIALSKYLDDVGFWGKVAFIDVGWKCSSQAALGRICKDADIYGYYIGVHKHADVDMKTKGYVFDMDNMTDDFYTVMGGMSVIEAVLTSREASLKRYFFSDGDVCFEYNQDDILNSNNPIFSVQKGILEFVKDYKNSFLNTVGKEISYEEAFAPIKKIIEKPNKFELNWFGSLQMENLGEVKSILPSNFIKNSISSHIRLYRNSGWKIGYVKNFSKVFPAKKIFIFLYDLVKGK